MDGKPFGIERRIALGLLGGAALGIAAPAAGAQILGAPSLPLATPADRLRAFLLMRGARDDRLVIGYLNGVYYGCVDAAMTPMFGVVSATFSRYRPHAAGGVEMVSVEQAYFIDLVSGARLTSYANPYTGRTVDVPAAGYPPARAVFTPGLQMVLAKPAPGVALTHTVGPFVVQGDDVWLTETTQVMAQPRPEQQPPRFVEVVGLHARLGELTAPSVQRVRAETSYTSVKSWRPWLNMDGHPGETVSAGAGLYGATVETLPAAWLAAARGHRPELIGDPAKVLDPLWRQT